MTDFQNDMYRRYLASGQAEKAEAFRQAGADQRGAELAQTEAEVREAVELHVYCDMCLSDIQSACRRRGVKLRKSRSRMEAALIEALVKERMEKLYNCFPGTARLGWAVPGTRDGGAGGGDPPGPARRPEHKPQDSDTLLMMERIPCQTKETGIKSPGSRSGARAQSIPTRPPATSAGAR